MAITQLCSGKLPYVRLRILLENFLNKFKFTVGCRLLDKKLNS